jgi:putative NIF3 family GTP cyclohydrolase 1 type 2
VCVICGGHLKIYRGKKKRKSRKIILTVVATNRLTDSSIEIKDMIIIYGYYYAQVSTLNTCTYYMRISHTRITYYNIIIIGTL